MSASALAIVLGPNILTQKDTGQDPTAMVQLMGAANSIVTSLIEEYPRIAEILPVRVPSPLDMIVSRVFVVLAAERRHCLDRDLLFDNVQDDDPVAEPMNLPPPPSTKAPDPPQAVGADVRRHRRGRAEGIGMCSRETQTADFGLFAT